VTGDYVRSAPIATKFRAAAQYVAIGHKRTTLDRGRLLEQLQPAAKRSV